MARMLALAVALGALLLVPATAPAAARPQIIGGDPAAAQAWPWSALLHITTADGTALCSGSLVAPDVVLTAAHCVFDESGRLADPSGVEVALGNGDSRSRSDWRAARAVAAHPGYRSLTLYADAAAIRLATPATGITPARVANAADAVRFAPGAAVTALGWGLTSQVPDVLAQTLQQGTMSVLDEWQCSGIGMLSGDDLCMSSGVQGVGPTTCSGDSGGPLVVDDGAGPVIVGLTSYGAADCTDPQPWVAQRADAISSWVADVVAGPAAPGVADPIALEPKTETSARVRVRVSTNGARTTVKAVFRDGRDASPAQVVATGTSTIDLVIALRPWTTSHVRVVATSAGGTTTSPELTVATSDSHRPTLALSAASGRAGAIVRLGFTVRDNSGTTRARVELRRNGKRWWRAADLVLGDGHGVRTARLPAKAAKARWTFCVTATDGAGNATTACRRVVVKAARRR